MLTAAASTAELIEGLDRTAAEASRRHRRHGAAAGVARRTLARAGAEGVRRARAAACLSGTVSVRRGVARARLGRGGDPFTNAVKITISRLRAKLGDPPVIETVAAVASVWVAWLLAGRVLSPLRSITSAAREISATSLDRRLALDGPDDELKELGDTFDRLLERLDASFSAQRQFVANASHELRTPLARLKTLTQVDARRG